MNHYDYNNSYQKPPYVIRMMLIYNVVTDNDELVEEPINNQIELNHLIAWFCQGDEDIIKELNDRLNKEADGTS